MALKRSESTKTTLSMLMTRSGKYQKWLGIINVFILLSSLFLIFYGAILKLYYHMDTLDFVSVYFELLPILLISLGVLAFLVSAVGFVSTGFESRTPFIVYAVLMTFLSIAMLGTVFVSLEVRSAVENDMHKYESTKVHVEYPKNPTFASTWDVVQRRLRCCGGKDYLDFHSEYELKGCVPKSCCIDEHNCQVAASQNCRSIDALWGKIYVIGCMKVLKKMYQNDLESGMFIVAVGIVVTALASIVGVALASAFVAQLTRRAKRFEISQGVRDRDDTLNMDDFQN